MRTVSSAELESYATFLIKTIIQVIYLLRKALLLFLCKNGTDIWKVVISLSLYSRVSSSKPRNGFRLNLVPKFCTQGCKNI